MRGLIEKPGNQTSQAIIIIIPGYGETNFVEGHWYSQLRSKLLTYGLTVIFWDKMGCGNSEGEFDIQQPVENSADEAMAAIRKIQELQIPGYEKIGFWGVSRAGWIVPLINLQFPMAFWISISGTDDKENFGYLLKSNLTIVGKPKEEVERLYQAWVLGHKIESLQGNYEDLIKATEPLRQDSTCRALFGYSLLPKDKEEEYKNEYLQKQKLNIRKGHFDEESGLWAYIDDFDQTLQKINCPVLALFGEKDSQVDWRKTKKLYESTIGINPKADLTSKVFEDCNHDMRTCITCRWGEDLSALNWQYCDGYFETMEVWLKKHNIID
ncbi:hypothetical protein E1176_04080 [Fulvivirga sp. RKSG066]|nr:hypothetical protein [Fulvivirga aurantia]